MFNRLSFGPFALALIFAFPAHAEESLRCPAGFTDEGKTHGLERVSLFNDPTQINNPGKGRSGIAPKGHAWNLADYKSDNKNIFLICHYDKTDTTTIFMIPNDMKSCKQSGKNAVCN